MEQKLHTPEGVRDIYSRECEIKLTLQEKIKSSSPFIWISRYSDSDV